ncbi:hypothetical protein BDY19DRAFT_961611 [Irpex rosettiformis]|uniref:Uncharacterized protein n=1 Tax=Irpex rosettiformis TaxID=378272 RepID=A0ACB8TVS5_9APHY|nr:hypothetical protein BDY19DRAFT_961611 [Irpex rosettiformis]
MSNPHQHYAHPGPSYYHSAPPPPHYYNNGPMPYYPYPMNTVNGHSPPPPQPSSPRMNGSSTRGGYHPHRGGHHYQPYPYMPPQHYVHPQATSPAPTHPQPNPYSHPPKYAPHLQHLVYAQPFRPSGQYPPHSWSQQTLSPLPKQLSMPAQLPSPLPPSDDSPAPPTHHDLLPEPVSVSEQGEASSLSLQSQEKYTSPLPPLPPAPPPPAEEAFEYPVSTDTTTDATKADVPSDEPEPSSSTPSGSEVISAKVAAGIADSSYVIWSRKPRHPSRAVGVMISARALPPSHIIDGATNLPTPPSSPKPAAASISVSSEAPPKQVPQASPDSTEVASSSTTEATTTAPVTPTAGTPASTSTSVTSAAPSPVKQSKPLEPTKGETREATTQKGSSEAAINDAQPDISKTATNVEAPVAPTAEIPASKLAVTVQKKSWASLLQSNDSASTSKSRLPTSTVVGFSIPAGVQSGSSVSSSSQTSAGTVRPEILNLLNSGPSVPGQPLKIRPRGLINTGNMCFANAVLQVLVYCPPFWRLFTELGKYIATNGSSQNNATETPLIVAIIQFLKEFGVKEVEENKTSRGKGKEREEDFDELDSFIPTNVYEVMKENKRFATMVGGHQEDAEEFLGFFLDTLEDELLALSTAGQPKAGGQTSEQTGEGWLEVGKRNRAANTRSTKSTESPITKIFGGKFRSTLKAPHQRDSVALEDWRSLRLDIQREQVSTIKDALQFISHPHSVEISSATRPGVILDATRQELIESLPPILILHLKRFLYDTTVGDVVKIGKHVTFGPELEIGADLLAKRPPHPIKYQLIGALYHHGQSASGGHYTLDVLHPNRDLNDRPRQAWIRIDDELVSDIRAEDVFGGQERDDRCAYLLFYRRIGPGVQNKAWSQLGK